MTKSRNWRIEFYPESAPNDWEDILRDTFLPIAISPLHDKDLKDDGTLKKPHYHVIVQYPNTTTDTKVLALCDALNAPRCALSCDSVIGAYEYFTHKNHSNKHQYLEEDIIILNGFSIPKTQRSNKQIATFDSNLFTLIRENQCYNLGELVEILFENDMYDEYTEVKCNCFFWTQICKSLIDTPELDRRFVNVQEETRRAKEAYKNLCETLRANNSVWERLNGDVQFTINNEIYNKEK